jgi:sugar O-acyltransferase (sialic acid O-acetyltransferase NeuD family)
MKLMIFGTGGHAESTLDLAVALHYEILGCISPESPLRTWNGIPIHSSLTEINFENEITLTLGVGSIQTRKRIIAETSQSHPNATFETLIHPTAHVSPRAKIGMGTSIFANTYIGPSVSIGNYCVVNTASCIEHNSIIEDHAVVAPGVTMGGAVEIGSATTIGIGAVISNKVKIGHESIIGGNSFVNKDIPANVVAYGSPARIIRNSRV